MRASLVKFLAPAIVCLIVSGCGGGSTGGGGGSTGGGGGGGNGGGGGGGSTPTTVTVSFAGTPTALATQIGTGAFTAATLTSGALTLNIPSGTTNFAVAYICPDGGCLTSSRSWLEGPARCGWDLLFRHLYLCASHRTTLPTGTLTGSGRCERDCWCGLCEDCNRGQDLLASGYSELLAKFLLTVTAAGTADQSVLLLPSGTDRVLVTGANLANPVYFGSEENVLAVRNFEGVTIPGTLNGGNTVTLGAADEVTMQPITYKNVPSGFPAPTTIANYEWSDGGMLPLSNAATTQYPAIPAAAAESGDYYSFGAVTEMSTGGAGAEAGVSEEEP